MAMKSWCAVHTVILLLKPSVDVCLLTDGLNHCRRVKTAKYGKSLQESICIGVITFLVDIEPKDLPFMQGVVLKTGQACGPYTVRFKVSNLCTRIFLVIHIPSSRELMFLGVL